MVKDGQISLPLMSLYNAYVGIVFESPDAIRLQAVTIMGIVQRNLSNTFRKFFDSEKSSGILLIICTVISLLITNSSSGADYLSLWQTYVGGLSFEPWINDALMAIFFLLIGLELERELYDGDLSNFKNALLPIFAAIGGMVVLLLFISHSMRTEHVVRLA
jgi:Na+/H+ antiporter NhaA